MTGPYAPVFWTMVICNCGGPLLLLLRRVRTTTWSLLVICVLVNVGMWLERFNIVVTSLAHDRLPVRRGGSTRRPGWSGPSRSARSAGSSSSSSSGSKLLPPVSIAELKEDVLHGVHPPVGASGEGRHG